MLRRPRRRDERGQTLALALVFVVFFAVLSVAVVALARAVDSQHESTERTAAVDSVAEGSAQFAMADAGSQGCGPTASGSGMLNFPSVGAGGIRADTLTYSFPAGSSGCTVSSTGGNGPGSGCVLCVLNTAPDTSSPAYDPTRTVLTANKNGLNVMGEIDTNGTATGSVTSTKPIGLLAGADCPSCHPSTTTLTTPFHDPLAGTLPTPSVSGTPGSFSGSGGALSPGVYCGIDVQPGTEWLSAGTYVVTGGTAGGCSGGTTPGINVSGAAGLLTNSDTSSGGTEDVDSGGLSDSGAGGAHDSGAGGTTDSGAPDSGGGSTVTYTSTTLKDTSKNWTTNQWKNAVVTVTLKKGSATGTVTGNTKNTVTVSSWSSQPSNTNAYTVSTILYTPATLTDVSKSWTPGEWVGALVTAGGVTGTVASSTAQTLTMSTNWSSQPANGTAYSVVTLGYTSNTLVDASKTWTPGQWVGALVSVGSETNTVSSNTAHTLTMTSNWSPSTPISGSAYTVVMLGYTKNTLVDATKSWAAGEWVGALVAVGAETDTVASNTAHTLTLQTNWNPTTPTAGSAYTINGLYYTSTTLVDISKSWTPGQWSGALVAVGTQNEMVTSSTATTLTVGSAWSPTPAAGTAFAVTTLGYTANSLVDASKSWIPGQWVGAVVTAGGNSGTVASNTATTLTLTANWTPSTPAALTAYSLSAPVVIYLACPTSAPYWSCATAGQAGATVNTSGKGALKLTAPTTGPYAGIAMFSDPNLTDPGSSTSVFTIAGNGGDSVINGTLYLPRGSVDLTGGGMSGTGLSLGGRLVVRALFMGGNGNSALSLGGSGVPQSSTCYVFNDTLVGTEAGITAPTAQVRFETGCASAGLNGRGQPTATSVLGFAYGP
jgi:hypothetical protein